MISANVKLLLSGYQRLTPAEKKEFIEDLNKISKGLIKEGSERLDGEITLGPLSKGCPCCGR